MSKTEEETKFLLAYKFRAYPSALLEYRMENRLYILHNLYDPSLKLVHSQVLQDCLRRVDNAFQKFFRREAKYTKKKKLSKYNSFTFQSLGKKL